MSQILLSPGFQPVLGLAGNPVTGHLLAVGNGSSGSGIYDINPVAGTDTFVTGGGFDGIAVSPDGLFVYGEISGGIAKYNIGTGGLVWFTGNTGHAPDGTAVITGGTFDGYIVVNNNDGTVELLTPAGGSVGIIATGRSRGDFVSPD